MAQKTRATEAEIAAAAADLVSASLDALITTALDPENSYGTAMFFAVHRVVRNRGEDAEDAFTRGLVEARIRRRNDEINAARPEGSLLHFDADSVPVVGMGATVHSWSDRRAYTVVEVVNDRTIVVQEDKAVRLDTNGMSEIQTYAYYPNAEAPKRTFTRRTYKSIRGPIIGWREKGQGKGSSALTLGHRNKYHDYSF